jgi:hypothetical protein
MTATNIQIPWGRDDVALHGLICISTVNAHVESSTENWNKANDAFFKGDEVRDYECLYDPLDSRRIYDWFASFKTLIKNEIEKPGSNRSAKKAATMPLAYLKMNEMLEEIQAKKDEKAGAVQLNKDLARQRKEE